MEVGKEGREDRVVEGGSCWVTTNGKRAETNKTNGTRPATYIKKKEFLAAS